MRSLKKIKSDLKTANISDPGVLDFIEMVAKDYVEIYDLLDKLNIDTTVEEIDLSTVSLDNGDTESIKAELEKLKSDYIDRFFSSTETETETENEEDQADQEDPEKIEIEDLFTTESEEE